MRKCSFLSFLIILVCSSVFVAQPTPPPLMPTSQWEYLVIEFSGGGSYLISTEKEPAVGKVGWREDNYGNRLVRYADNRSTQAVLDEMGKRGWELISVASAEIKSFVFKRPFIATRSAKETAELEKLEQDVKAGIKPVVKKEPLVDLDRADARAADDALANQAKSKLEQAIRNAGLESLVSVKTQYSSYSRESWAEVMIDGSAQLLKDGNKYRETEAKKYVNEVADKLFKNSGLQQVPGTDRYYFDIGGVSKRGEIVINLSVFIKYNGRDSIVSRGAITGNWMAANQQKE